MTARWFVQHLRIWLASLALLAAAGTIARAEPPAGQLVVEPADNSDQALVMRWSGRMGAPMAAQIRDAFERNKGRANRVVLKLNSGGGAVLEGERVIEVLREIRTTHALETVVEQGQMCGSMCVFVYLQGQKRTAALSSLWLFHEISHHDPKTHKILRLDRAAWENLVAKYYPPAGVSQKWADAMRPFTVSSDYWQTGADLIRDHSGIVHVALGNQRERVIAGRDPSKSEPAPNVGPVPNTGPPEKPKEPEAAPAETPRQATLSFETKGCRVFVAEQQTYVNAPCG